MGKKNRVVFLDIDGVLCTTKSHVANDGVGLMQHLDVTSVKLLSVLLKQTYAKLVLSSTWREFHKEKISMTAILQNSGMSDVPWHQNWKTPITFRGCRGEEIQQWLKDNGAPGCSYVIIDDNSDFLDDQLPYFVQTEFDDGFTYKHYLKALEILKEQ